MTPKAAARNAVTKSAEDSPDHEVGRVIQGEVDALETDLENDNPMPAPGGMEYNHGKRPHKP